MLVNVTDLPMGAQLDVIGGCNCKTTPIQVRMYWFNYFEDKSFESAIECPICNSEIVCILGIGTINSDEEAIDMYH